MTLDQKRARVFGVLYLITFVTSIPALMLYEPALRHPVGFIAGEGNVNKIYLGALLELLLIIANIGTTVVIVPIMRRQFEELSIGYVTARIVECTFILVGIVAMLGIATLHRDRRHHRRHRRVHACSHQGLDVSPRAGLGRGLGERVDSRLHDVPHKLVPRWGTWLGLVGGPLIIISGTIVLFGGDHGGGSFQGLATIPEFLWELFLGVYCTIWGFRRDAPILSGAPDDS